MCSEESVSGQHWVIAQIVAVMCTGPEVRLLWKLQVMLGSDELRNTLQAVAWVYLSAEVRHKTVKQYCTGYKWLFDRCNQLHCDIVGGNAFKLRPVLGGHNFHQSWGSWFFCSPSAHLQKIAHYSTKRKIASC